MQTNTEHCQFSTINFNIFQGDFGHQIIKPQTSHLTKSAGAHQHLSGFRG